MLAPVALALSLLAAEIGLSMLGFWLAHALVLDPRREGGRHLWALLPVLAVMVVWRLSYDVLGYGAQGSGAYLDPLGDPLGFMAALPERGAWMLVLSLGAPLAAGIPSWLWWTFVAVMAVAILAHLASQLRSRRRSAAVFGALGLLLGSIPLCASTPGDRLLVATSFGAALVLGSLLDQWLVAERASRLRAGLHPARRGIAACVVLVTLVAGPALFVHRAAGLDRLGLDGSLPRGGESLDDEGLSRKGLVVVHAPDHMSAADLPAVRRARGLEAPNFLWILHTGPEAPQITRTDARTLEIHDPEGFAREPFSAYWRSFVARPFAVGDELRTVDYRATVLEVAGGRPTRVRFAFRTSLDHPSFCLATWDGHDYAPWSPPT